MTAPALALTRTTVRYGRLTALSEVTFAVRPGERVALVGPSGAGKSTVIRLLNGTQAPTSGSVHVLGVGFADASATAIRTVRRRVATIHQRFHLVDQLRVIHNVNAGHLGSWSFAKALVSLVVPRQVELARQALDRVGIGHKIMERTADLSGGEQQRVAIARALVQQPSVLLADEPVASLDPARSREVMGLLHDVSQESGSTLLASLHDVELATDRFERLIGLRHGRIVFDAPRDAVTARQLDDLYALTPCPAPRPSVPPAVPPVSPAVPPAVLSH